MSDARPPRSLADVPSPEWGELMIRCLLDLDPTALLLSDKTSWVAQLQQQIEALPPSLKRDARNGIVAAARAWTPRSHTVVALGDLGHLVAVFRIEEGVRELADIYSRGALDLLHPDDRSEALRIIAEVALAMPTCSAAEALMEEWLTRREGAVLRHAAIGLIGLDPNRFDAILSSLESEAPGALAESAPALASLALSMGAARFGQALSATAESVRERLLTTLVVGDPPFAEFLADGSGIELFIPEKLRIPVFALREREDLLPKLLAFRHSSPFGRPSEVLRLGNLSDRGLEDTYAA